MDIRDPPKKKNMKENVRRLDVEAWMKIPCSSIQKILEHVGRAGLCLCKFEGHLGILANDWEMMMGQFPGIDERYRAV